MNENLTVKCSVLEVLDKGKAAAVTSIVETVDKATGQVVFENQSTVFIRGSGGFGGKRAGKGKYSFSIGLGLNSPIMYERSWACDSCKCSS